MTVPGDLAQGFVDTLSGMKPGDGKVDQALRAAGPDPDANLGEPVASEAPPDAGKASVPPPDGADLLRELERFLTRFVRFSSEAAPRALALWILHTHAFDACEATPYMGIVSPVKRCGKTRLEEVLRMLVRSPWKIDGAPTEAVLFRKIEKDAPTLLLDEADAMLGW